MNRSEFINQFGIRRVVLKIGTNLLLDARSADGISGAMLDKLRDEIIFLRERGIEVLLVSSGAVGSGRHFIKKQFNIPLHEQPSVTRKQALSAIGQHRLMARYESTFAPHGIPVAQLLLTAQDFRDRRAYLNMGHTISELMRLKALPIVNENDTVATDELLQFGENDILSAACLALFHADLLLILTSVDGFLLNNQRIPWISEISDEIRNAAGGPAGPGSGGMQAKIRAGELCAISGAALAILPGQHAHPVRSFFQGEDIGTLMVRPRDKRSWGRRLSARKSWLLFARTQGGVVIDAGAVEALRSRGKSLLPAGVRAVRGHFLAGDVIHIEDDQGHPVGRGISNFSYAELRKMLGMSTSARLASGMHTGTDEVIHRNNMTLES